MRKNNGQALVEFVLILPIFILILITMLDFGNIMLKKYSLENDLDVISEMYENNKQSDINSYITENDIRVTYERNNEFITIKLYKDVNIMSPVLSLIMGDVYSIDVSGVYYE